MPSFPSRNKTLAIAVKNYAQANIKVFCSCLSLLDPFTLFSILYVGLQYDSRGKYIMKRKHTKIKLTSPSPKIIYDLNVKFYSNIIATDKYFVVPIIKIK